VPRKPKAFGKQRRGRLPADGHTDIVAKMMEAEAKAAKDVREARAKLGPDEKDKGPEYPPMDAHWARRFSRMALKEVSSSERAETPQFQYLSSLIERQFIIMQRVDRYILSLSGEQMAVMTDALSGRRLQAAHMVALLKEIGLRRVPKDGILTPVPLEPPRLPAPETDDDFPDEDDA
jgi:hypothetical protein